MPTPSGGDPAPFARTRSVLVGDNRYTVIANPDPAAPDAVVVDLLVGAGPPAGRLTVHPSALPDLSAVFAEVFGGGTVQARPAVARRTASGAYDTLLNPDGGGPYSTHPEEVLGRRVLELVPESRHLSRSANSAILRATKAAVGDGIRQILDLGHGLPGPMGLVHELAKAIDPSVRYVGVDIDLRTVDHMWTKVAVDDHHTMVFQADLTDWNTLRAHPRVREMLDFSQPMLVVLGLVAQFVNDDDLCSSTLQAYYDLLAPGSRMVITLPCADASDAMYDRFLKVVDLYEHPEQAGLSLKPIVWSLRNLEDIRELLPAPEHWMPPGVVPAWQFRPNLEPLHPVSDEQAEQWGHAMIAVEIHVP